MGRTSKLTDKQWNELEKRLIAGESGRSLSREFEVSESAIRKRLGAQTKQIKQVAIQMVVTEQAFSALPIGAQISARTMADELKAISMHLAGAGKYGAMTAHRLSSIAHVQTNMIDDSNPSGNEDALRIVSGLTKMANSASEIPINLLRANKDIMDGSNSGDDISQMTEEEIRAEIEMLRGHR